MRWFAMLALVGCVARLAYHVRRVHAPPCPVLLPDRHARDQTTRRTASASGSSSGSRSGSTAGSVSSSSVASLGDTDEVVDMVDAQDAHDPVDVDALGPSRRVAFKEFSQV